MLQVGRATLTSHRLLWTDTTASPEQGSSCQVPLSAVHEVLLKASMMLRSPKIRVFVYVDEHSKPAVGMLDLYDTSGSNNLIVLLAAGSKSACQHSLSCMPAPPFPPPPPPPL